jgi:hypothetical protein
MQEANDKAVTVICASYRRYRKIHVLIHALLCQTLQNWKLLIIHDGPDERMRAVVQPYTDRYAEISYLETEQRHNDYGHSLRERGIGLADTPFLMMTNDDNYYAPVFLEIMFGGIEKHGLDFAYCDFISSHSFAFKSEPDPEVYTNIARNTQGQWVQAPYNVIRSKPHRSAIDIGNFIVRSEMAREVGFRDKGFAGDGTFVQDLMERYRGSIKAAKVNQVLYMHN